jgi:hypothetical protein
MAMLKSRQGLPGARPPDVEARRISFAYEALYPTNRAVNCKMVRHFRSLRANVSLKPCTPDQAPSCASFRSAASNNFSSCPRQYHLGHC